MSLKKKVVILSTALTLTGTTALPVFQGSVSASEIDNTANQTDLSDGKDTLINKYDQYVELGRDGFFKLKDKKDSNLGSQIEVEQVNKLINDSNKNLKNIYSNYSQNEFQNQVTVEGDSVVLRQSEKNDYRRVARSLFSEGSSFVKQQWWGYTIGISRTDLRKMGPYIQNTGMVTASGLAIVGMFTTIAAPVSAIVGGIAGSLTLLGFGWSNVPFGIVFNLSGGQAWGVLPQ